jgi:hypothetical protein
MLYDGTNANRKGAISCKTCGLSKFIHYMLWYTTIKLTARIERGILGKRLGGLTLQDALTDEEVANQVKAGVYLYKSHIGDYYATDKEYDGDELVCNLCGGVDECMGLFNVNDVLDTLNANGENNKAKGISLYIGDKEKFGDREEDIPAFFLGLRG